MSVGDIDIDMPPSFDRGVFGWTRASRVENGKLREQGPGVYPQNIPVDPLTGMSAIPYHAAEDIGYFKLDLLHLHVYSHYKNRSEIDASLKKVPDWSLMLVPSNHPKLFQLSKHGDLIMKIKPKSVEEVAELMALIRPAAVNRHIPTIYQKDRELGCRLLWAKTEDGYAFKKSHALGYAFIIWLQLNLIEEGKI